MTRSLESSRPIMAPSVRDNRTSTRFSTYSTAPTLTPSIVPSLTHSIDTEMHVITEGLDKLENKKLGAQRYVPSEQKTEVLSKLALGAKLERALERRMDGQDAVMRVKPRSNTVEKEGKRKYTPIQISEKA